MQSLGKVALSIARGVGKVLLAIILALAGMMLASLVGGGLAGFLGALFRLSNDTISLLVWAFPKIIFVAVLVWLYIWEKRKRPGPPSLDHLQPTPKRGEGKPERG
jgi:hypothetical protein